MKTKIVCMGDSITEGFGVEERESYPYRLGVMLGEDYEVVNKGVCCSTAMNLELDGFSLCETGKIQGSTGGKG